MPEELFERYQLKVGTERIDGQQFDQSAALDTLREHWKETGVTGGIIEKDGVITLSRIVVPEGERNAGKGTAAMKSLLEYADRTGQHVALSPSADFGGNKERLTQFYKRLGFVENKGKNRAFSTSESMYRQAEGDVLNQSSETTHAAEEQFRATERAYGGQEAFEKAKAEGKTKLNYRQWVQVRTPNFKRWFGDWEIAGANTQRDAATFTEAREQAKAFQGKPLTNVATGIVATVSRNSLDKMLSGKSVSKSETPATHSLAVANLDVLFERAKLGWSKPDSEGDPNIKAIHRFFAPVMVDGHAMLAKMTVKETAQDNKENPLYTVEAVSFDKMEGPAAQWVGEIAGADGIDPRTIRSAGLIEIMAQQVQDFKQDKISKVTDSDTGEPMVVYHGTPNASFNEFSQKFQGAVTRATSSKSGFFFVSSPRTAKSYADHGALVAPIERLIAEADKAGDRGDWDTYDAKTNEAEVLEAELADPKNRGRGQSLIPVFLSLSSPLEMDANGEVPDGIGGIDQHIQKAKRAKNDGVIIRNFDDAAGLSNDNADHYIVFDPANIKSTIGNDGNFDKNDPNILHQSTKANGNRGSFDPATLTISLLKKADLSTFLHESGHFFLEVQVDIVSHLQEKVNASGLDSLQPGERQMLADMDAMLGWFGVNSLAEWHSLDFEEKRSYHEKFARGFESYLFEGKSPNIEMQGIFQRFRAWMLNVYKDIKNLNIELSDEVRGVFDRMLATTEQIQLAERGRSMMPLFSTAQEAGMTPEEFAEYQALGTDATNEAIQYLQARGLRDMAWLHNARGRIIKKLKKEAKEQRAEVQMDVRREVMSQPMYRAWQFLTGKLTTDQEDGSQPLVGRLSLDALNAMDLPVEVVNALKARRMTKAAGLHPDVVAEMFGFTSGDELVRTLAAAETPYNAVNQLTDQRMLEQFGDLTSQDALEKAADMAIHNDARARFVATELNALAKATGKKKVLNSAAKEFARAMIDRLRVRDIRPGQYANAEARAAKASEKARKAGDLDTAAAEKRNQLIQISAARAAYDAKEEVAKGLRYLKKFDGKNKGLDAEYVDQIHKMLERFDLRKGQSLKAIDKRKSFAAWMEAQREIVHRRIGGLEGTTPLPLFPVHAGMKTKCWPKKR